MKQSRAMSLVEAAVNVVAGYVVALAAQMVVFPFFNVSLSFSDNLLIGAIFTVVSLVRSYVLRRVFEAVRVRGMGA